VPLRQSLTSREKKRCGHDETDRLVLDFWEKGMFANQNVVAKLRQPFTLQRLAEVFKLDDLLS
jgi:hypothetical protein